MATMTDPGQPPVPPTPPAPPAPPLPPVPRYGEYAPEGYVPPQPVAPTAAPQGYGETAVTPPPAPVAPGARVRKTWDLVLTCILLVLGLFGMLIGVVYGLLFTDTQLLSDALAQQGYPGFSGDAGAAPAVLIISHIALYLLAVGISIPMLLQRRIAFWVPLTIGVIAAIVFWSTLTGVLLSDPNLVTQLS